MARVGYWVLMQHAPGGDPPGACCAWVLRRVPLCVKASGSVLLAEFLEHGAAQLVQGQSVGLDQQSDRAGAVVGEADHGPPSAVHRLEVDLDRVLGVTEQREQPDPGCGVLAAGDGLLMDEHEHPPADEWCPGAGRAGEGLDRAQPHPLGRVVVGLPAKLSFMRAMTASRSIPRTASSSASLG